MTPRWQPDGPEWLGVLAVALVGVAATLVGWPVRPDVTVRRPAIDLPGEIAPMESRLEAVEAWRDAAVTSNLFSSSRRAPSERFRLPGLEAGPAPMAVPEAPGALGGPAPEDSTALVLMGLVQVNGARQALLAIAAPDSAARLVGVGGRIGPYRVRSIGPDHVDVTSMAGPRTLRLSRPSPSDSSELPP